MNEEEAPKVQEWEGALKVRRGALKVREGTLKVLDRIEVRLFEEDIQHEEGGKSRQVKVRMKADLSRP